MTGYARRTLAFAFALTALAGYVDALGFLSLGGFFVSFMSGNSTRLGVGVGHLNSGQILLSVELLSMFLLGVITGFLIRQSKWSAHLLYLVTALLFVGALLDQMQLSRLGAVPMTIAMGSLNATFERNGDVGIGVTYVTGALVKMGQRIALALTGGPRADWVPFFLLWLSLVVGAALGTVAFSHMGSRGLWFGFFYAVVLIPFSRVAHEPPPEG